MRDLDELKRKKVFQTALLRVQFPDRGKLPYLIDVSLTLIKMVY